MKRATSMPSRFRLQCYGFAYLLIVAGLVWFSIAAYNHEFSDNINVVVKADNVGDQLNPNGDVRMNGALVGRVASVDQTASGATIHLQIDSTDADRIPRDVVARILPTTLFGQKYVELLSSTRASAADHLVSGSVIQQDHSQAAVELEAALNDLYPVLKAIDPAQLATTLGSLATALDGHGDDVRQLMASAAHYLSGLNSSTATFEADLALLNNVARNYSASMPALVQLLQRSGAVSDTLSAANNNLPLFIANLNTAASAGQALLDANQRALANSLALTRPTIDLLAQYAPEIDCVIGGFLENQTLSAAQVRNNSVHGYFTIGNQASGYTLADQLRLGDTRVGPHCSGNPVAQVPYPAVTLKDGVKR